MFTEEEKKFIEGILNAAFQSGIIRGNMQEVQRQITLGQEILAKLSQPKYKEGESSQSSDVQ